jgi:molybdate transport system ATP-binding protein
MSAGLRLELTVPCRRFEVSIAWETERSALGLFGPSGSGKTTVLEAIAGLRPEARGRVEVGGRTWLDSARGVRLAPEARGVGYVPQDTLLFPHLDVLGNLGVGLRRARASARRQRPERVLDVLELEALARRPVAELSGGERQRVALGRALCSAPDLLLLDEPLASLDLALRRRILPYLVRVRDELGIPTLHVSHDASEVTVLCDEVCVLSDGRVVGRGRPDEVFAAGALAPGVDPDGGFVNVLRGAVERVEDGLASVALEPGLRVAVGDDGGLAAGRGVAIGLRASDVILAAERPEGLSAQNVLPAVVREVRLPAAGAAAGPALVVAELGRTARPLAVAVSLRACRELGLAAGSRVHLVFKAQACRPLAAFPARAHAGGGGAGASAPYPSGAGRDAGDEEER